MTMCGGRCLIRRSLSLITESRRAARMRLHRRGAECAEENAEKTMRNGRYRCVGWGWAMAGLLLTLGFGQSAGHPNYDDEVKPLFARRCFGCHSAGEMRSGLNLEAYGGVLKGGSSGDAVIAGRAASSMLYRAVAREEGAPQMPLGQAKLPDAEIALIREWIQGGLLETAVSVPKGPAGPSATYSGSTLNKPSGTPAMTEGLPVVALKDTARAHPVTALAASPWAPLVAVAGHDRIYLYDLSSRQAAGELAFPEGVPYVLRFSRDGAGLLAAGGRGVQSGKAVLFDVHTGKRIAAVGEERDVVLAADVSADGKLVALGGPGKIVKVYTDRKSTRLNSS